MPKKATGFTVVLTPDSQHPGWVNVSMRKQWWAAATGTASRELARTAFHRGTMSEREVVETMLREMLLAWCDRLE